MNYITPMSDEELERVVKRAGRVELAPPQSACTCHAETLKRFGAHVLPCPLAPVWIPPDGGKPEYILPDPRGWVCPTCAHVYSPSVLECPHCPGEAVKP